MDLTNTSDQMLNNNKDVQMILAIQQQVIDLLNEGKTEDLLALHTDNVVLMEPDMPAIEGKENVRKLFQRFNNKQIRHLIQYKTHELEVFGRRAFVRGSVQITKIEQGNKDINKDGKFICLFLKQTGGSWLRSHIIVNTD